MTVIVRTVKGDHFPIYNAAKYHYSPNDTLLLVQTADNKVWHFPVRNMASMEVIL